MAKGKWKKEANNSKVYVYRYIDLEDRIIKYVGITTDIDNRVRQHRKYDDWCKFKEWEIEYFKCDNRTEAEAFESHLISLYGTDKYYNIGKFGWGVNKYLPDVEDWWKEYEKEDELYWGDREIEEAVTIARALMRERRNREASIILNLLFGDEVFPIREE